VKAESARQICCSKTLVAQAHEVDRVRKLCQEVADFSKTRMADRSNGIQEFAFMQDQWDSNVFHFWERYKSNVHMGRHNTTAEVVDFMEEVNDLLEQPVGMALYEYRNGQIGPVCLQGGPKGEGGLDDATGASGAVGGASMRATPKSIERQKKKEQGEVLHIMDDFQKEMSKQGQKLKSLFGGLFGGKQK